MLIAASGTGGHLFPAIATAAALPDYHIEWLGVPDRLERQLVPEQYPMHTIAVEGFQQKFSLKTVKIALGLGLSILKVRKLLRQGQFDAVFTTGGYIAGPAVVAARSLGLPVVLHESNALPGKVTRFLSRWCDVVALGFGEAAAYLPKVRTMQVGTPVRPQFLINKGSETLPGLPIPADVPLIVVVGGSQGAVAVNRLVRQCAPAWLDAGIWIVHQTGENDPDAQSLSHPHYFALPFYSEMAALFRRSTLAISRAGAGTLTELAVTHTPSILIPYPFAAEDHQTYNAKVFANAGAALLYPQSDLTPELLTSKVLHLLQSSDSLQSDALQQMADATGKLAILDSGDRMADIIRSLKR
nr:undecaprenyldiphospho-muramoylpentapeptide beta-N-acetylglucosaminyltransferase [Leptolyngbya ohadii]